MTSCWPAPAKLNLFLHITGRRADGYHELQTVFQFLDHGDLIDFQVRTDGAITRLTNLPGVAPDTDLTVRAARLLQAHTGTRLGAGIRIDKRLPMGGGLGGGSSDAATTLVALNHLWELHLPREELCRLGVRLGADVPIFIYGRAAWAEGVGEHLTPIEPPQRWYVVIIPDCHVSTAEIFNAPELTRNCKHMKIADFLAGSGINVCEPVVAGRYPRVAEALSWLARYAPARMTGTGACVFAGFETGRQARAVLAELPAGWSGFTARGMNRSPLDEHVERLQLADKSA